jgi:hypothetical protein
MGERQPPQDIESLPEFPTKDDRQPAYRIARAAIGTVDTIVTGGFVSSALQETLDAAIGAPLEARRTEWLVSLAKGFEEMCQRVNGFDPARLGENPEFVSVVAGATQIAMRTHREEKREALRNAVLNTAEGASLNDVLLRAFMGYIDSFSGLHLKVLKLLSGPENFPQEFRNNASDLMLGGVAQAVQAGVSELRTNPSLISRILADLEREGLLERGTSTPVTMSALGMLAKRTTGIGDAFLEFISTPSVLKT